MKNYRILEHTTDLHIQGFGKTINDAIEGLALGMFENMDRAKNPKRAEKTIKLSKKGYDLELMIVELFSDIIAEIEGEDFIPKELRVKKLDLKSYGIEVEIVGANGVVDNIIKSATYHLFEAKQVDDEWIVSILFDI